MVGILGLLLDYLGYIHGLYLMNFSSVDLLDLCQIVGRISLQIHSEYGACFFELTGIGRSEGEWHG